MYILGINAYHGGASACMIRDGELIAAVEEERFRRVKYWAGFPKLAIEHCLREAGIAPSDLDTPGANSARRCWMRSVAVASYSGSWLMLYL